MRRMRFAWWVTGYTRSKYAIVTAFPRQQWLHERASILRYTYIDCLVVGSDVTLSRMQVLKAQVQPMYLRAFCASGHDVNIIKHMEIGFY